VIEVRKGVPAKNKKAIACGADDSINRINNRPAKHQVRGDDGQEYDQQSRNLESHEEDVRFISTGEDTKKPDRQDVKYKDKASVPDEFYVSSTAWCTEERTVHGENSHSKHEPSN